MMIQNYPSRLSYTHERADYRQDNPIYAKANSITMHFEINRDVYRAAQIRDLDKTEYQRRNETQERAEQREAFMLKRQRPKPVLKPRPSLAYGPDSAAFESEWQQEQKQAERWNKLQELKAMKADLLKEGALLSQYEHERKSITLSHGGLKTLFKLERKVNQSGERVQSITQNVKRGIHRR